MGREGEPLARGVILALRLVERGLQVIGGGLRIEWELGRQRGRSIEVWFVGLDLRKWVPIPIRGSGGGWRAVDGRAPSP